MKARRSPCLIAASALLAFSFALSHGARATTSVRRFAHSSSARSVARAAKTSAAVNEAVFDLRDFGAVGDGSNDDGPALQHALDALAEAGGGTLVVPEGKYVIATPVARDFTGLASSLTIRGVESATTVDVNAAAKYLTAELGLVSEFYPRTGDLTALDIKGLQTLLVSDLEFVGTPDALTDAFVTLDISDVEDATVRHCEFYGLATHTTGGAILLARRSALRVEQTKFLGSFGASGNYTPDVQNLEWKGISFSDVVFADYGQRSDIYCKCDYGATWAWVNVGNAAATTPLSPRREVVFRNLFLDEGSYVGLSSLPTWFQPPTAPIDLLYVTGLRMNVSNFGTTGNYFENVGSVLIEDAQYGWSHNAGSAIGLHGVGSAIISRASLTDAATVITADAATGSLTVINSTYAYLDSQAQTNREITTQQPDGDPVLYVRERFAAALGRDPDAAAHFYWSSLLLQCGDDADCFDRRRLEMLSYLGQQPQPNFAIAGVASDENGSPLAGVAVTLEGSQSAATETGADGSYRFANLPTSGVYTVNAAAPRHCTFALPSATFTTPPADVRADFAATLKRHQINGQLTDEQGRAITGATLTLSGAQSAVTTTDDEGNYSFPDLPEGAGYTVTPSSALYSFAVASQTFDDLSADAEASFAGISLFHTLGGRVVGASGAGLPGVGVTLSGARSSTTTTDDAGNFSFADLPRGAAYTLTPSLRFYASAPASQTFDNLSADAAVVFNMSQATHTIGGRVTENGAGLGGVTLTLSGAKSATAASDAEGNYSFTNLNAGASYTVTPSSANYTFVSANKAFASLDSNQTLNFTASLVSYRVGGRVTENGSALSGVTMTLSGSLSATTMTDAGGNYFFDVPAEGNYTVTPALANRQLSPASQTFNNLSSNQTASFTASPNLYTISGRVVFGNNVGLPGVTVALTGAQSASTTTDSNGNFSFKSVPAVASYTITPSLADFAFAPASQSFDNLSSDKSAAFSAALVLYKLGGRVTAKGAGLPGVSVTLDAAHTLLGQRKAEAVTGADGSYSFNVEAGGDYTITPSLRNYSFDRASASFDGLRADGVADFAATLQTVFEFSAASYAVGEGAGSLDVTVTRAGDTSGTSTVSYSAQDATAQQGRDLSTVVGRLNFASGETSKSFKVFVTDDSFVEGAEELTLRLTPGAGAVAGAQSSATLTINDNDADASVPNPADDTRFFVRQHYRDFLGREPDDAGLQFWTDNIEKCGTDQQCRAAKRVDTSAAFFLSIEFKETGFLVHRAYVVAYGRAPRRVDEFLFDSRLIGDGVVVGQTGWEQRLESNKQAFFAEFVARGPFAAQYPLNLTPAQFVAALAANAGGSLPAEEVSAAVAEFGAASDSADADARVRVLRRVAESRALSEREVNRAFVLMQYFGYLQRNPDDAPDASFAGYDFWLSKLDEFSGDYQKAEMVRAFVESAEYRARFGK